MDYKERVFQIGKRMKEDDFVAPEIHCSNCLNSLICFNRVPDKGKYFTCNAFEFKK